MARPPVAPPQAHGLDGQARLQGLEALAHRPQFRDDLHRVRLGALALDEALGDGGGQQRHEADAGQHHHHCQHPALRREGPDVAVADGRHGRDRPPDAVPGRELLLVPHDGEGLAGAQGARGGRRRGPPAGTAASGRRSPPPAGGRAARPAGRGHRGGIDRPRRRPGPAGRRRVGAGEPPSGSTVIATVAAAVEGVAAAPRPSASPPSKRPSERGAPPASGIAHTWYVRDRPARRPASRRAPAPGPTASTTAAPLAPSGPSEARPRAGRGERRGHAVGLVGAMRWSLTSWLNMTAKIAGDARPRRPWPRRTAAGRRSRAGRGARGPRRGSTGRPAGPSRRAPPRRARPARRRGCGRAASAGGSAGGGPSARPAAVSSASSKAARQLRRALR